VIVVSDAFWRRRLGADPSVLGRALTLGGISRPIVGVMPPSFRYPTAATDVWLPTRAQPSFLAVRTARLYTTIGRLKPGVTLAQALNDLNAIQARLGEEFPDTDKGWGASLVPLKEEQVGGVRRSLWLLLGAVALVLLAACGNVACLLLADATRREHEMAIRLALGADRRRVFTELVREGVLLALAGSMGGLLLARWGLAALRSMAADLPRIADVQVDRRLVLFTFAVGVITTLFFALAPALHSARSDPAGALARGGRGHVGGRHLLQRLLVGSQVALAIVLLTGAGLLIRSFARTQRVSIRVPHRRPGCGRTDVCERAFGQCGLFPNAPYSDSSWRHLQQRPGGAPVRQRPDHAGVRGSVLSSRGSHRPRVRRAGAAPGSNDDDRRRRR
jgi:putative ABC transport system permease protein